MEKREGWQTTCPGGCGCPVGVSRLPPLSVVISDRSEAAHATIVGAGSESQPHHFLALGLSGKSFSQLCLSFLTCTAG